VADPAGASYRIMAVLGEGAFGRVYEVQDSASNTYALKIIGSNPRFSAAAQRESQLMNDLQSQITSVESVHFLRLIRTFLFQNRFCLLLELLYVDLYIALTQLNNHGFKLLMVQNITRQLFESLVILERCGIIHGDLKPENIMFVDSESSAVKIGDFGVARVVGSRCPSYIQSRYYRAPEVVLGFPHGPAIDVWSVGCIMAEIFLGLPLFGGQNQIQLLAMITELIRPFPREYIQVAPNGRDFFGERTTQI
jgi:dual specificity protein kinase YAK1